jgi:outer membrane murein-binding lipoprotein Lpp
MALNKAQTEMANKLREQSQAQNDYHLELQKSILSPHSEQRALASTTAHSMLMTPNRAVAEPQSLRQSSSGFQSPEELIYASSFRSRNTSSHHYHPHLPTTGLNDNVKNREFNIEVSNNFSGSNFVHEEDDKDSLDLEYEKKDSVSPPEDKCDHRGDAESGSVGGQYQIKSEKISVEHLDIKRLHSRLEMLESEMTTIKDAPHYTAEDHLQEKMDPLVTTINARIDELEGKVTALSPSIEKAKKNIGQENQNERKEKEEKEMEEEEKKEEIPLPLLRRNVMEQQIEIEQDEVKDQQDEAKDQHYHNKYNNKHQPTVGGDIISAPLFPFENFERSLPTTTNDDARSEDSLPGFSIPTHSFAGDSSHMFHKERDTKFQLKQQKFHGGSSGIDSIWSGRSVLEDIVKMRVELESALKVGELATHRAREAERIAIIETENSAKLDAAELHRSKAAQLVKESHVLAAENNFRTHISRVHDEVRKFVAGIESRHLSTSFTRRSPTKPIEHKKPIASIESIESIEHTNFVEPIDSQPRIKKIENSEQKVREKLEVMMNNALQHPLLFSATSSTNAPTTNSPTTSENSIAIELKIKEAARLRKEADLLSMKAEEAPFKHAQNAVHSYVQFNRTKNRSNISVSSLKEQEHNSKKLNLKSRIRDLDRSLDRRSWLEKL